MIQKPDTILALFEGHPERWTKDAYARVEDGDRCPATSEDAVCWCLLGALLFVWPTTRPEWRAMYDKLYTVAPTNLTHFNDHSTFEQIVSVVREAGV